MNRRQLLASVVAGAAVLSCELAFAGVSPERRRSLLDRAWQRALAAGTPLLVLVIPKPHGWERGSRFGVWLNNASDADLAPLAGVELACAQLDELERIAPGVAQADGAWMVLVQPHATTPTWRSVIVPPVPDSVRDKSFEDFTEAFVAQHGDQPDWGVIRKAYTEHQQQVARGRLQAELEAFRASIGRVLASEGLTGGSTARLAQQARERWVRQAPPGAHWARATGCGAHIERNPDDKDSGRDVSAMLCGMGHVEAYAARFLHFWDVG